MVPRDQDVVHSVKESKMTKIVRNFCKETSVFADWDEDSDTTGVDCIKSDFKYWRVGKFVQEEEDMEEL